MNFTYWPSELKIFIIWSFNNAFANIWTKQNSRKRSCNGFQGIKSLTQLLKSPRVLPSGWFWEWQKKWRLEITMAAIPNDHHWGYVEKNSGPSGMLGLSPCLLPLGILYSCLSVVCRVIVPALQCWSFEHLELKDYCLWTNLVFYLTLNCLSREMLFCVDDIAFKTERGNKAFLKKTLRNIWI